MGLGSGKAVEEKDRKGARGALESEKHLRRRHRGIPRAYFSAIHKRSRNESEIERIYKGRWEGEEEMRNSEKEMRIGKRDRKKKRERHITNTSSQHTV